jgi:hypothetical protein
MRSLTLIHVRDREAFERTVSTAVEITEDAPGELTRGEKLRLCADLHRTLAFTVERYVGGLTVSLDTVGGGIRVWCRT